MVTEDLLKNYIDSVSVKIENQMSVKPTLFTIGIEYSLNEKYNLLETLVAKGYNITEVK